MIRPPRHAAPTPVTPAGALCADIGGSFIKFGPSFGPGRVAVQTQLRTPAQDWPEFVAALAGLTAGSDRALPLAISVAALVDPVSGRAYSANIPCLNGRALASELTVALARPVLVANDADAFAMAEAEVGAGTGCATVFCLILGTGVGGGLVVNGRPLAGPGGVIAEWGHGAITQTRVTLPSGEEISLPRLPCGCGRSGCTDTIGGARGIERLHLHLTGLHRDSFDILDGWEAGGAAEDCTIAVWLQLLAEPLAFLVNVLGPGIMPVGGGLAARTALIAALDRAVRQRILHDRDAPLIVPGRHFREGGLVGMSVLGAQFLRDRMHDDAPA